MALVGVFFQSSKSQVINEGVVRFTTTTIDTINNITTELPDTIYYKYFFKGKNSKMQYGTDSINNSFIVTSNSKYSLNVVYSNKRYSYDSLQMSTDSLMNFWDTSSVKYSITTEHKTIRGYYCTKGYFFYVSSGDSVHNAGDTTSMMAFWFTDRIKGNNLIPGAGETSINLNGLILGYEILIPNGVQIVSPLSVSTEAIDDSVFFPNLAGYVNDDNNNNGSNNPDN